MDKLAITITAQNDSILKVRWTFNRVSYASYNIDFGLVRAMSDVVKRKLAALVSQCMDSTNGGAARAGVELRDVAKAGRALYKTLFLDAGTANKTWRPWRKTSKAGRRATSRFRSIRGVYPVGTHLRRPRAS